MTDDDFEHEHARLASHHQDRDAQDRRALAGEEPHHLDGRPDYDALEAAPRRHRQGADMTALDELERLDQEEATPGPWRCGTKVRRTLYRAESMGVGLLGLLDRHEDTALIVAMRNALPALLNVARAAEAAAAMGVPTTDAEVAAWIAARDALRAALAELGEAGK